MSGSEFQRYKGAGGEGPRSLWVIAAGWVTAGLLNAPFVLLVRPLNAPFSQRLFAAAADVTHFSLLGTCFGALLIPTLLSKRINGALLSWAALTFGAAIALRYDLENLAERTGINPAVLRAGVGAALAGAYLGVRRLRAQCGGMVLPWVSLSAAAALTLVNLKWVPRDYPGLHLFVAGCTACVAEMLFSTERLHTIRSARWVLSFLPVVSLPLVLLPNGSALWKRLLSVPSSAAAPYLAGLLAPKQAHEVNWLQRRYPEWFASGRDDQRPTGLVRLPDDAIVLLLTIDALRADVVASGKHDAQLPELARLRQNSVWFTRARSPAPSTLCSMTSLFSGMYYSSLYWTREGNVVLPKSDTSQRLPAILSRAGVRAVQAISIRDLVMSNGVTRGFDVEVQTPTHYGSAADLMDLVLSQLDGLRGKRAFLTAHFVDAHAPYTRGGARATNFESYLAELALVDHELGRLRARLRERGMEGMVTLIVSADHGEAFGEHGQEFHSTTVYDELLRVPLMIAVPGVAARRVDVPVTLLDLSPTILDFFDQATPRQFMGQSLSPLLVGGKFEAHRPIAADTGRRVQALLFPDGIKAIRDLVHGTREVYDLNRDPLEQLDLTTVPNRTAEHYLGALDAFFASHTLVRPGWEPPWRKF